MSVPCIKTKTAFDVQCPVCGCGFLLLTEPTLDLHRGFLRHAARAALARHHEQPQDPDGNVHPEEVFDLPCKVAASQVAADEDGESPKFDRKALQTPAPAAA